VEYDYRFRTNNFGLVEDTDVMPARDSVLLVGDSFSQGLGAEPWFRLVGPEIERLGYQPVNGGLVGTGFEQWLKLDRYLAAQNVRVRKLVVVFISDDYRRPVWNLTPGALGCLSALSLCHFQETLFYRLPPPDELSEWIAKIRTARAPMTQKSWLGTRVEALLPASYYVYKHFSTLLQNPMAFERSNSAEEQSRTAIADFIRTYGTENVAFIHVPQKEEIDGPNKLGLRARSSIREAGGKLFDGFKLCGLTPADYYANDDHPNRGGYAKIAHCVNHAIDEMIAGAQ
jgi:hypothetical protein